MENKAITGLPARIYFSLRVPVATILLVMAARAGIEFAPDTFKQTDLARKSLVVLGLGSGIWGVDRVVRLLLNEAFHRSKFSQGISLLLRNITRILIFAIGSLIILDSLGVSITPILASLGIGSLAVALALQDTLNNMFSAFYILVDRPVRIGDFIKLEDGTEGTVLNIGWRSTHIRLLTDDTVVLPNSKLSSSTLVNYSMPENGSIIHIPLGVAYVSNLDHVQEVTVAAASEVCSKSENAFPDFLPYVRFRAFGASSIDLTLSIKVRKFADRAMLQHEMIMAINTAYNAAGISIPFPQQVVHLVK